jgi:hypothetical protein
LFQQWIEKIDVGYENFENILTSLSEDIEKALSAYPSSVEIKKKKGQLDKIFGVIRKKEDICDEDAQKEKEVTVDDETKKAGHNDNKETSVSKEHQQTTSSFLREAIAVLDEQEVRSMSKTTKEADLKSEMPSFALMSSQESKNDSDVHAAKLDPVQKVTEPVPEKHEKVTIEQDQVPKILSQRELKRIQYHNLMNKQQWTLKRNHQKWKV